jgi:chemotaxis regulatin CheY-phosphate phosphatase CheZ
MEIAVATNNVVAAKARAELSRETIAEVIIFFAKASVLLPEALRREIAKAAAEVDEARTQLVAATKETVKAAEALLASIESAKPRAKDPKYDETPVPYTTGTWNSESDRKW